MSFFDSNGYHLFDYLGGGSEAKLYAPLTNSHNSPSPNQPGSKKFEKLEQNNLR